MIQPITMKDWIAAREMHKDEMRYMEKVRRKARQTELLLGLAFTIFPISVLVASFIAGLCR